MKSLHNPKLIFLINTLPSVILFSLFYGQFNIIHTLLEPSSIDLWRSFGITLAILTAANFAYAIIQTIRRRSISIPYAALTFFVYTVFLYLYVYKQDGLFPRSLPTWMFENNFFTYTGSFLMPTLAYAFFLLVVAVTPQDKDQKAWKNLPAIIAIPVLFFLFPTVIAPLWQFPEEEFFIHVFLILFITLTLAFLFFLVRFVLVLSYRRPTSWDRFHLLWRVPIVLVFPILGLLLNNGAFFGWSEFNAREGIFGDFNNPWFYILAVINGVLLCLPSRENKGYRIALFAGRSICFTYTLYFFLVFLPFLPLSIIGLLAFGLGLLMLTPLLLLPVHIQQLYQDFTALKSYTTRFSRYGILVGGFFVIPVFITLTFTSDRNTLNECLDYLYSPDYSKRYRINKAPLQRTLNATKRNKSRRGDFFSSSQTPFISAYFNWIVLKNLTLSESKTSHIERVFFGHSSYNKAASDNIRNRNVLITNISIRSDYDISEDVWKSWVDLEISNQSGSNWFAEYATTFQLPEGCWISDYYLYVGDRKEMGILAEKKSALWIFSQIRNENRDPGLLYYLNANHVGFRVFPFSKGEVRKTGIEFLHKTPVSLNIDGNTVVLGDTQAGLVPRSIIKNDYVHYIPTAHKQKLRKVQRKPLLYFLVDASQNQKEQRDTFTRRIRQFLQKNPQMEKDARFVFVDSYSAPPVPSDDWERQYASAAFNGGFFLDRAIKKTLFDAYKKQEETYPVIVVVTKDMGESIIEDDFSDFAFAYPESDLFFALNDEGLLESHSLRENPLKTLPSSTKAAFENTVLEYRTDAGTTHYLRDDDKAGIVLGKEIIEIDMQDIHEKDWQSGLLQQAQWMSQTLHPESKDRLWLNLLISSFKSRIMSPVSSYIVVENEAQKAMLMKKQKQAMEGKHSLDLGEERQRMSEPGLLILATLFGVFLLLRKKRR